MGAHTLAYDAAIVADIMRGSPVPVDRWSSVTLPMLVVAGGASPAWFHSGAQALTDILPNAQRHTLERQAHDVAPEVLAPVMTAFFLG